MVSTALRALDRGSTPPNVVSSRLNWLTSHGARLLNRRQAVHLMGRINARFGTAATDSDTRSAAA